MTQPRKGNPELNSRSGCSPHPGPDCAPPVNKQTHLRVTGEKPGQGSEGEGEWWPGQSPPGQQAPGPRDSAQPEHVWEGQESSAVPGGTQSRAGPGEPVGLLTSRPVRWEERILMGPAWLRGRAEGVQSVRQTQAILAMKLFKNTCL